MAITSSTLTFNSGALLGCGIDAELVRRFDKWLHRSNPPPSFIFTPAEIRHFRVSSHPAAALCASYCCKEAVVKALGSPINFTDCELLWTPLKSRYRFYLLKPLRMKYGVSGQEAFVDMARNNECVVSVFIFGRRRLGRRQPTR